MLIAAIIQAPESYELDLQEYIQLDPRSFTCHTFELCHECDRQTCAHCLGILDKLKSKQYAAVFLFGNPAQWFVKKSLILTSNRSVQRESLAGYNDVFSVEKSKTTSTNQLVTNALCPYCYTIPGGSKIHCWLLPHVRNPSLDDDEWNDIWQTLESDLRTVNIQTTSTTATISKYFSTNY